MTEDELRRIEEALKVLLPDDYRTVMKAFPFRAVGNDWVYWMYEDPERVIDATRRPLGGCYEGKEWRLSCLVFGQGADGDPYLLDLDRTPSPVYCLSHETQLISSDYPNLEAYVADWKLGQQEAEKVHA